MTVVQHGHAFHFIVREEAALRVERGQQADQIQSRRRRLVNDCEASSRERGGRLCLRQRCPGRSHDEFQTLAADEEPTACRGRAVGEIRCADQRRNRADIRGTRDVDGEQLLGRIRRELAVAFVHDERRVGHGGDFAHTVASFHQVYVFVHCTRRKRVSHNAVHHDFGRISCRRANQVRLLQRILHDANEHRAVGRHRQTFHALVGNSYR